MKENNSVRGAPSGGVQQSIRLRLTDSILRGVLQPGTRLSPARIAEEFGSSHIPVREALASLEASGYVVRRPRIGYFVAELPLDQLMDLYHWRSVLEDEAHRVAVEKLRPEDIQRMKVLNSQMLQAVGDRTGEFLRLNREFHFVPFRCTGSPYLGRFLDHLWDASARHQNVMEYARVPPTVLATQHDALVAALEQHDAEAANLIMREHRHLTLNQIANRGQVASA